MQPFGIILIGYLSWLILSNKFFKETYIVLIGFIISLELFINVGYMFTLWGYEVTYIEFVLIIIILYSIHIILMENINKKIMIYGLFLLLSVFLSEVLLTIQPLNEAIFRNGLFIFPEMSFYSLMISLRILIFIVIAIALKKMLNKEFLKNIINYIYSFGMIIFFIVLIEWIIKNILKINAFQETINLIFGKGDFTVNFLLTRGSLYSLQGLTREPSHLASGVFYFLVLIILSDIDNKKMNWALLFGGIIFFLSGSFSSVLYILALAVIYISKRRLAKTTILIMGIIILFMMPLIISSEMFQYYYVRLVKNINSLTAFGAQGTYLPSMDFRIESVIETFKIFLKRPLFGVGLGIPYAYGFLSMLFASIGCIGAVTWYNFVFKGFGEIKIQTETFFILLSLIGVWMFIGSIGDAYSIVNLVIILEIGNVPRKDKRISV